MWWFTTRKSGINAVNLKELLGFGTYGTAWCWLQKLRRCSNRGFVLRIFKFDSNMASEKMQFSDFT
jgi:hypothetical protein